VAVGGVENLRTLDPFGTEATRERALYRERQGDPVSEVIARSSNSYPRGGGRERIPGELLKLVS